MFIMKRKSGKVLHFLQEDVVFSEIKYFILNFQHCQTLRTCFVINSIQATCLHFRSRHSDLFFMTDAGTSDMRFECFKTQ